MLLDSSLRKNNHREDHSCLASTVPRRARLRRLAPQRHVHTPRQCSLDWRQCNPTLAPLVRSVERGDIGLAYGVVAAGLQLCPHFWDCPVITGLADVIFERGHWVVGQLIKVELVDLPALATVRTRIATLCVEIPRINQHCRVQLLMSTSQTSSRSLPTDLATCSITTSDARIDCMHPGARIAVEWGVSVSAAVGVTVNFE